jgi:hypothetical protein
MLIASISFIQEVTLIFENTIKENLSGKSRGERYEERFYSKS